MRGPNGHSKACPLIMTCLSMSRPSWTEIRQSTKSWVKSDQPFERNAHPPFVPTVPRRKEFPPSVVGVAYEEYPCSSGGYSRSCLRHPAHAAATLRINQSVERLPLTCGSASHEPAERDPVPSGAAVLCGMVCAGQASPLSGHLEACHCSSEPSGPSQTANHLQRGSILAHDRK